MSSPPPGYETIVSDEWHIVEDEKIAGNLVLRWNICEVVSSSRTQHVASIVEQILPQVRSRAEQGYSTTELVLVPSDETNARSGEITGLDPDQRPLIVQFEDKQNTKAFWWQPAVIAEFEKQLKAAIVGQESALAEAPMQAPPKETKPVKKYGGWFGSTKDAVPDPVPRPPSPVSLTVCWDDLHSRIENEYGLVETKRASAVFVFIHVR